MLPTEIHVYSKFPTSTVCTSETLGKTDRQRFYYLFRKPPSFRDKVEPFGTAFHSTIKTFLVQIVRVLNFPHITGFFCTATTLCNCNDHPQNTRFFHTATAHPCSDHPHNTGFQRAATHPMQQPPSEYRVLPYMRPPTQAAATPTIPGFKGRPPTYAATTLRIPGSSVLRPPTQAATTHSKDNSTVQ